MKIHICHVVYDPAGPRECGPVDQVPGSQPTNAHCPRCGRFVANAGQHSVYCRTCMDGMVKDYEVEERERGRIP